MNRLYDAMGYVGAALLLVGVALEFVKFSFSPVVFTVGAVLFAYVQIVVNTYKGSNFIIKRLRRQQIAGAALLILSGFLMIFLKHNEWVLCLSVAAVLELYTAFRIPSEIEREKKKK